MHPSFIALPMSRFNPCFIGTYSFTNCPDVYLYYLLFVLILVLLELILLHEYYVDNYEQETSFNPCFIGTYSFTQKLKNKEE